MLDGLARKFGETVVFEGVKFFLFPEAQRLAEASVAGLAECGLGYRARYVSETSKRVSSGAFELERLKQLPYEQAKRELMSLAGVGAKVADCVLLFGFGVLQAFPVDVWVKRVLLNHYAEKLPVDVATRLRARDGLSSVDYRVLNNFGRRYFDRFAGYAQEYLYHYERVLG
jgi:N-glycosylase/DNA lyase